MENKIELKHFLTEQGWTLADMNQKWFNVGKWWYNGVPNAQKNDLYKSNSIRINPFGEIAIGLFRDDSSRLPFSGF